MTFKFKKKIVIIDEESLKNFHTFSCLEVKLALAVAILICGCSTILQSLCYCLIAHLII